jgi:metal-responsive CopG/Arc/MetJ family transcriptional regulator
VSDAPVRRHPSFSVNLPAELRRELEAIASRELSAVGQVIRRACVLEVERNRRAQRRSEETGRANVTRATDGI